MQVLLFLHHSESRDRHKQVTHQQGSVRLVCGCLESSTPTSRQHPVLNALMNSQTYPGAPQEGRARSRCGSCRRCRRRTGAGCRGCGAAGCPCRSGPGASARVTCCCIVKAVYQHDRSACHTTYLHLRSWQVDAADHLRHRVLHLHRGRHHCRAPVADRAARAADQAALGWRQKGNQSWMLPDCVQILALLAVQWQVHLQLRG
jgi:hypothetical protein